MAEPLERPSQPGTFLPEQRLGIQLGISHPSQMGRPALALSHSLPPGRIVLVGPHTGDSLEYGFESGVRLHGALDVAVYYRFQSRDNVLYFGGFPQNQNLFGIKVMF